MANEPIITITGNLTGDPELRYVSSGTPVASFTVASTPSTLKPRMRALMLVITDQYVPF